VTTLQDYWNLSPDLIIEFIPYLTVNVTDPVADDLIASEHSPRREVEVMSKRLVDVLAESVDVTRRQKSGQRQELIRHNRSTDRSVPSTRNRVITDCRLHPSMHNTRWSSSLSKIWLK